MTVLTDEEFANLDRFARRGADSRGLEVLHLKVRGTRSRPIIEIVLDGAKAVQLDDCEVVSRQLQTELDGMFGENINYRLDVTSPGTDEPLIHDYQFVRNIGRDLELVLADGRKVNGKLVGSTGGSIEVEAKIPGAKTASKEQILRSDIKKARVMVGF